MPFSLCRPHQVSTGQGVQVSTSLSLNDSSAQIEQGVDNSRAVESGSSRVLETSEKESVETGSSGDLETSDNRSSETARWWTNHPVITTILFAAILSFLIELAQWKWGLGLAETDDVIMNTLGAGVGTLAFSFFYSRSHPSAPSLDHKGD